MFWETPIIPIVSEEDTTIFPRKREHSMIVAPVEANLPTVHCVQTVPLEELNGARAKALIK